jgi:APA family basic amino acid/polyamine antiporter
MADEKSTIVARLSTFDTAMVVFSLVVGIGIFRAPAIVAGAAGSTELFFTAWVLGGAIALVGALTFAEIGARYARAGGYYRVVAECYHPALAFMLNWCQTLMQGAGAAGVAFIGVDYLGPHILPPEWLGPQSSLIMALALMIVLLTLNFIGIRSGARTQNILSVLKIAMMIGLSVFALLMATRAAPAAVPIVAAAPLRPWSVRLLAALVPCFYAYGGYQLTMNLSADIKDSSRKLPIAIVSGMLAVVALYLLLNLAYQQVLGIDQLAIVKQVAAALARATFGRWGDVVISVAIFLSAAGFVNATILQMPRTFYAMSEDGVLPKMFRRVNPKTQVQEVGLIAFGLTMLVPAFFLNSFDKLVNYVIFTDNLTLAVVASTLFVLRRRGVASTGFVMPGYPWLPALYFVCLVAASMRVLVTEPMLALAGTGLFLTGLPLFLLGRGVSR